MKNFFKAALLLPLTLHAQTMSGFSMEELSERIDMVTGPHLALSLPDINQDFNHNLDRKPMTLSVTDLTGTTKMVPLGGSEGHGGDYIEMRINNFGWMIYDRLMASRSLHSLDMELFKNTLDNLAIEIVDSLRLNNQERDAVNVPDHGKWYLSNEAHEIILDNTVSFEDRAQFFLHEFLPLINIDDSDYRVSKEIVGSFKTLKQQPVAMIQVLLKQDFGSGLNGVAFKNTKRLCEKVKRHYEKDFFAIMCLYKEKRETRYVVTHNYWTHIHRYFFGRSERHAHRRVTYRPYLTDPVYGLKILGLGPVSQLEDKYIINGLIDDMPTYGSYAEAMVNCTEIVAINDDTDFLYYKAKCEAFSYEDGFRFHIKTKNPLLH